MDASMCQKKENTRGMREREGSGNNYNEIWPKTGIKTFLSSIDRRMEPRMFWNRVKTLKLIFLNERRRTKKKKNVWPCRTTTKYMRFGEDEIKGGTISTTTATMTMTMAGRQAGK